MMIKGKNKKGFLLGEFTLKLIIAIMGILILIYLLFRLYSAFSNEDKLAQAGATLDALETQLNAVNGGVGSLSYLLVSPKSWVFVNYPGGRPTSCGGSPCLCICKAAGWWYNQDDQCNDKNIAKCKIITYLIVMKDEIEIAPAEILINKVQGGVSITKK